MIPASDASCDPGEPSHWGDSEEPGDQGARSADDYPLLAEGIRRYFQSKKTWGLPEKPPKDAKRTGDEMDIDALGKDGKKGKARGKGKEQSSGAPTAGAKAKKKPQRPASSTASSSSSSEPQSGGGGGGGGAACDAQREPARRMQRRLYGRKKVQPRRRA